MSEQLEKLETGLIITFSNETACNTIGELLSEECYATIYDAYKNACELVENGAETGTTNEGDPIDIGDYPIRKLPPIKKGFDE